MAMGFKNGLGLLAFCALSVGCSPIRDSIRVLIVEPHEYCLNMQNRTEKKRYLALADQALGQYLVTCSGAPISEHFAHGFKEGFADYLYAGGTGAPPAVPPRCYWSAKYDNAEGRQAIEDWFAGFRRGAAMARSSGFRERITVPASTTLLNRRIFESGTAELEIPDEYIGPLPQPLLPQPLPPQPEQPLPPQPLPMQSMAPVNGVVLEQLVALGTAEQTGPRTVNSSRITKIQPVWEPITPSAGFGADLIRIEQ
jgi:hypothetical protein